jgi:hypothetical protein
MRDELTITPSFWITASFRTIRVADRSGIPLQQALDSGFAPFGAPRNDDGER